MISASVPFAKSHRHYSHLLMIYPLYIMTPEQPENRELVVKSLKHWMGMPKRPGRLFLHRRRLHLRAARRGRRGRCAT